ncbi:hypothetical protein MTR_3g073940 [Medicago truncatula]|uniref:Transmembrane protein n=1 Tax=Medicago truncatula TaxID=3880 RepID=G8A3A0_MEDTR|nr:hypothetical protein MTR_3g073940 [Medicago truncatula]
MFWNWALWCTPSSLESLLGASQSHNTIRPLTVALCFHQLFDGLGLRNSITQVLYSLRSYI